MTIPGQQLAMVSFGSNAFQFGWIELSNAAGQHHRVRLRFARRRKCIHQRCGRATRWLMGNLYVKNRGWDNPCRALSGSVLVHLVDLELRPESVWVRKSLRLGAAHTPPIR